MSGTVLLRCETKGGSSKWRGLIDLQAHTLCRQFGLDAQGGEHRFRFDFPRSAHEIRTASDLPVGREVSGFIIDRRTGAAFGKVVFAREGERFRDVDPSDSREFERLGA